jgi:hypothetical protein
MIKLNNIPYGALYTLQPSYFEHLIHDQTYQADDYDEMEVLTPSVWEVFVIRVKAFFELICTKY